MTTETEDITEEKLVSFLFPYAVARDTESTNKSIKESLGKALKAWLEDHPGDVLRDGERNLSAFLQDRKGTPTYDLITLHEKDPLLFERLLKTGCLAVNDAAVKAQGAQVGGVDRYKSLTPSTSVLQVKETT